MTRPRRNLASRSIVPIDPPVSDFDPQTISRLVDGLPRPSPSTMSHRLGEISRRLLGRPYRVEPLGGGPGRIETLSLSVSDFDCVTFVEHVVALAMSGSPEEFPSFVRRLRYRRGEVTWKDRNHYMTSWIANNTRERLVRTLAGQRPECAIVRSRRLDVVPGVAPRDVEVGGIPKREFLRRGPVLRTGDLLFFLSTRRRLDVFHCGLVVAGDESDSRADRMRHAARSRGRVVEQSLESFVAANRMAGILAVRPLAP